MKMMIGLALFIICGCSPISIQPNKKDHPEINFLCDECNKAPGAHCSAGRCVTSCDNKHNCKKQQ
jgi:hypothetical protein